MILYTLGLKKGSISTTTPLLALITIFQTAILWAVFGEQPTLVGILGILLAVFCICYGHHFSLNKLIRNRASLAMLGVALCWGISSILHRQGAVHFGTMSWTSYVCLMLLVFLTIILLFRGKRISWNNPKQELIAAGSHFLTLAFYYQASAWEHVAYMSSLRRLSIVFSSAYRFMVLNETRSMKKMMVMLGLVISAVLITLFG